MLSIQIDVKIFLGHWLFLSHCPFVFIRNNCQYSSIQERHSADSMPVSKSTVTSLCSYSTCKCIFLSPLFKNKTGSHFSHLLSKLSLCITIFKKFYIDMTNEMQSPFSCQFTSLIFFKLSGLSCYETKDAYLYSIYPVFIILLEDKVGNQGPCPMTEQWRRGMRSMRAECYQEHFCKNWKFSLAAVVLDHDVMRS